MPTSTGGDTIGERLAKRRAELARVEQTIARVKSNGQGFNLGGTAVTQLAYDQALSRKTSLESEIRDLERRLRGSRARSGVVKRRRSCLIDREPLGRRCGDCLQSTQAQGSLASR